MPEDELVREESGDSKEGEKYDPPPCSLGDAAPLGRCCVRIDSGAPEKPAGYLIAGARPPLCDMERPLSPVVERDRRLVLEALRLSAKSDCSVKL